jgi:hypothetical protein
MVMAVGELKRELAAVPFTNPEVLARPDKVFTCPVLKPVLSVTLWPGHRLALEMSEIATGFCTLTNRLVLHPTLPTV